MLAPTDAPPDAPAPADAVEARPVAFALALTLALVLTSVLVALSDRARPGTLALVPLGEPVRTGVVAFNLFFALPYLAAAGVARLVRRTDDGALLGGLHAAFALGSMAAWLAAALVTLLRLAS